MTQLADATGFWPSLSLIVFLLLFVGMLVWLFVVPSARWSHDARMPLEDAPVQARSKEDRR